MRIGELARRIRGARFRRSSTTPAKACCPRANAPVRTRSSTPITCPAAEADPRTDRRRRPVHRGRGRGARRGRLPRTHRCTACSAPPSPRSAGCRRRAGRPTRSGSAPSGRSRSWCGRHGWAVEPENPGWQTLVQIVVAYRDLGPGELLGLLDLYADAAGTLAPPSWPSSPAHRASTARSRARCSELVLGDAAMAALRRIAQEDASRAQPEARSQDQRPRAGERRCRAGRGGRGRITRRVRGR